MVVAAQLAATMAVLTVRMTLQVLVLAVLIAQMVPGALVIEVDTPLLATPAALKVPAPLAVAEVLGGPRGLGNPRVCGGPGIFGGHAKPRGRGAMEVLMAPAVLSAVVTAAHMAPGVKAELMVVVAAGEV